MEVEGDIIWGNDTESEVFAEAHDRDRCIIFGYSWKPKSPQSLVTRIVTCYYDLPVEDPGHTFLDIASMREALWSSIREVWDQCSRQPSITAADITVENSEDAQRQYQWRISHESFSEMLYVFKGVDLGTFLESPTDFALQRDVCYHEVQSMSLLPRHPNIMPPPNTFVSVKIIAGDQQALVCGALYPFISHGTIDDQIESAKATGTRLPPICKATWCFPIASAIAHAHFIAYTFHMDIKVSNFLLDADRNLLLIDWEQSGAALHTLAPEADGSWMGHQSGGRRILIFWDGGLSSTEARTSTMVITAKILPGVDPTEVFSLGRCMWTLMDEMTEQEIEECDEIVVSWSEYTDGIPEDWKDVVNRCLASDPNDRIGLKEPVDFWKTVTCKDGAQTELTME
ncbi:MAG: hypothetical protein LQ345_004977 [Seirophora villosa]|nr:MAG: hypothetical protein LQ345_004977 [Seirophora villosa]